MKGISLIIYKVFKLLKKVFSAIINWLLEQYDSVEIQLFIQCELKRLVFI